MGRLPSPANMAAEVQHHNVTRPQVGCIGDKPIPGITHRRGGGSGVAVGDDRCALVVRQTIGSEAQQLGLGFGRRVALHCIPLPRFPADGGT